MRILSFVVSAALFIAVTHAHSEESKRLELPPGLTSLTLWEAPKGDVACAKALGDNAADKVMNRTRHAADYDPCDVLIVGKLANGVEVAVLKREPEGVKIRVLSGKLEGKSGWIGSDKLLR